MSADSKSMKNYPAGKELRHSQESSSVKKVCIFIYPIIDLHPANPLQAQDHLK